MTDDGAAQRTSLANHRTRARAQRLMTVSVAASVAIHAAVLSLGPRFARPPIPPATMLEVTLVKPSPLPVAPPERKAVALPEPRQPEPQRRPAPRPTPTHAPEPAAPKIPVPVLALPEPSTPAASAFAGPAARPQGPASAPAVPRSPPPVRLAVAPPSFSAAYLRNPAPRYPLAARRAGEQGTVMLRVLVSPDGQPARVELEDSSGSAHLDSAAVEAVKRWRFTPARRSSETVEGWVLVPIVFRLEG